MNRMTGGSNDGFRSSSARCDGLLLVAVLALVLGPAASGLGDVDTWKEASGGNFHDGNMWTDGSAPASYDGAYFDVPGTYTVSFFTTTETVDLGVTQGDVTFEGYDGAYYLLPGGSGISGGSLTLGTSGKPLNLQSPYLIVEGGGTLNVEFGSTVTPDLMWVYPTATVNLGIVGGGTLEVDEIIIDGGVLNGATAGALVFPNWGSMSLRNGGRASFSGDYALTSGTINVSGGSRLETTDGGSLTIEVRVNVSGGASTLTVGGDVNVGAYGFSEGVLDLANGTSGTIDGDLNVADSAVTSGYGRFHADGAMVHVGGDINVATSGLDGQYGEISIYNTWFTQGGGSVLTLGANVGDDGGIAGELLIQGGSFSAGAGTVLNETGRIRIIDSDVELNVLTCNGGWIEFESGYLSFVGDANIGEDGLFDDGILRLDHHELEMTGTLTVDSFAALVMDGGYVETGALAVLGLLYFNEGAIIVEGPGGLTIGDGGPLSALVTLGADAPLGLDVAGLTTVNSGSQLAVHGGRLSTGSLTNSGYATISGGAVNVAGTAAVGAGGNLTVSGGTFTAATLVNAGTLALEGGVSRATAGLVNEATGLLRIGPGGTATVDGASTNAGDVVLGGGAARLLGSSTLTNTGLIHGAGTIAKPVTNAAGGEIRAENGKLLNLTGANGVNLGKISLQGGTAEFTQALTNNGDILGRGTLIAHGGLTNHGDIAFSGGITDAYGDMTNDTGGRVMVSGRADVTFWDDVHNAGVLFRVSADSSATFFGTYSGVDIDGGGHVYFESDVTPGFSAAVIGIGGDVAFGPMANLKIELADSDNSDPLHPRYDALSVAGDVHLAGTLSLDWLPVPGDPSSKFGGVYNLVVYKGQRTGKFGEIVSALGAYLDGEVRYDVELGDGWKAVQITLHDLLDGDADLNGMVGYGDLLALLSGSHKGWSSGDFNFDGTVDAWDFILLKTSFGGSIPISSSVSIPGSVPEPATLSLLALGSLALLRRRGRK